MDRRVRITKRAFDVVSSSIALVLSTPVLAAIAAAIKLEDGGPVLYTQTRAGQANDVQGDATRPSTFTMFKFRTMRVDAEADGAPVRATKNDPRTTRIGRFLRRTRLDELPQLFNVLRGEMSLIGPRPERPETIEALAAAIPFFEERMRGVKPGITGLAQVNLDYMGHMGDDSALAHLRDRLVNPFRLNYEKCTEADDMRTKNLYDFAYAASLEKLSTFLRTDLEILLLTPLVMVRGKGQ